MLRAIFFTLSLVTCIFSLHGGVSSESEILNSPNNPLASLYGIPETNVHGVNVINGDYGFAVVDFHLPGSNPLTLQRTYSTGSTQRRAFFDGWSHSLCSVIAETRTDRHKIAVSQGALSGEIPYKLRDKRVKEGSQRIHSCKVNRHILDKGVTNCGMGEISGRTNLKNSNVDLTDQRTTVIHQTNGDGSKHTYEVAEDGGDNKYHYLKGTYKPTGCTTKYKNSRYNLRKVSQYDWLGNQTHKLFTTMQSDKELERLEDKKQAFHYSIYSEDGRNAKYYFRSYDKSVNKHQKRTVLLKKTESTHLPTEEYSYTDQDGDAPKKLRERRGESHKTQIHYYGVGNVMHIQGTANTIDKNKHVAFGRVKQIDVAVTDMDHFVRKCWFAYYENKKDKTAFTDVYDQHNYLTRYNYSTDDYRIRTIQRFNGNGPYHAYRSDRMRWGDSETQDESNLITHAIMDDSETIQFAEMYKYDERGNVLRKTNCFRRATSLKEHSINWVGKKVSGGELRVICSEFNALNLPTLENDGRVTTQTAYLERHHQKLNKTVLSSLVSSRTQKDSNGIFKREFFDYDQAIGCTLHIVDDGSGIDLHDLSNIRQRIVTRRVNKSGVFAGLPLEITTCGWDSAQQQERLIQRSEISYDGHGHVTAERHFDSDNALAFQLVKSFDVQGNLLYETDPLGRVTECVYNKYRCLLREQGPCPFYFTEYTYDLLQRPIKTTQVFTDGLSLSTQVFYDLNDQPIKEIGIYGQVTTKCYDEQNLLKSITEPPVCVGVAEWKAPTSHKTYDIFGHLASETDPMGAKTLYQNNPEGKVLSIQHPDGTQDSFCYSIYGDLTEKTAPNGTKTYYTYDSQGRVLSEVSCDSSGVLLKSHTYTYERSLLVSEREGDLITDYEYDYAGRVVQKRVGNELSEYSYDPLGRQVETRVYYGIGAADYISYNKSYDLLNRVVEEQEADSFGRVHVQKAYTYDERGNITAIVESNHAGIITTTKQYDPRGNLCAEIDALGNTTRYVHHYDYDLDGYTLPCVEKIDPTGVATITVTDCQGRVVHEAIWSPFKKLLLNTEMFYDLAGNLKRKERASSGHTIVTLYEYDPCNRLVKQIDGAGTPEQMVTSFGYNQFGELSETVYADGSSKHRNYDGAGRLKSEWSEDMTVMHSYVYNSQDLPVLVENLVDGRYTKREYALEGYLISERFENELTISYTYDRMGRITSCTYPDGSSVRKTYNPVSLCKTERIVGGVVLYDSEFLDFDMLGLPKLIQFPKNGGTVTLEYDLLNRPVSVVYPHFSETSILYDSRGLMVSKDVNHDLEKFQHDDLAQLTLEQTSGYSHAYQNDGFNRQTEVDGILQVHNAVHQLTQGVHGDYVFDGKGRRIRDSALAFTMINSID